MKEQSKCSEIKQAAFCTKLQNAEEIKSNFAFSISKKRTKLVRQDFKHIDSATLNHKASGYRPRR
jgi:hypothetical protein